jgi:hypothetical protein
MASSFSCLQPCLYPVSPFQCRHFICLSKIGCTLTGRNNNFTMYILHIQRLATGWTVRGSNPGGGEIFRTRPDWPWGPPSLLYNGYRAFPGGKAAEACCWPPTPFQCRGQERIQLYLYPPPPLWAFWSVTGYLYLTSYTYFSLISTFLFTNILLSKFIFKHS